MKGKQKRTEGSKESLGKMVLHMIFVLLGIIAVGILVSAVLSRYLLKQTEESIISATQYYAERMDSTFGDINDYLGELAFQDKDVKTICYTMDRMLFIQHVQSLNEKLEFYRSKLGGEYYFMVYYPELDYFAASERGNIEITDFSDLKDHVAGYIQDDYETNGLKARKKWWIAEIGEKQYALNYVFFEGWYACCFIEVSRLADTAHVIRLGQETYVTLVSENGKPYNQLEMLEQSGLYRGEADSLARDEFGMKYTLVHHPLEYAEFGLSMVVLNNQNMMKMVGVQVLVALILLAGILISGVLLYRVKTKIVAPMKYFSDNLTKIQNNSQEVYFDDGNIQELAEANELFRKICNQMKELKIRMYEQELDRRNLQIDYMRLQIQPHFYINCMSLIYNMAVMGEDDTIQQLSACVSDYFRYMFRSASNRVSLREEIKHLENYLEICRIRYKERFTFRVEKEDELDDVQIPVLFLHTFVENSVKYASDSGKDTDITLKVHSVLGQEEEAEILIEDNGTGFPENVLDSLQKQQDIVTEKGTRIGIQNCIQRLKYLYGDRAQIVFENKKEGGARVKILLPIEGEEKNEYSSCR